MEFLFSNLQPLKTKHKSFDREFYDLLGFSNEINIAVGYVTADSITELQKIVEINKIDHLNLIIGMHYLDLFTEMEYEATKRLNDYLISHDKGSVKMVIPFRYHGKLYTYSNNGTPVAGIIGSNNLSSIVKQTNRTYEASCVFRDKDTVFKLNSFINELDSKATRPFESLTINKFKKANPLLEDLEQVAKVPEAEINRLTRLKTDISFKIPLKTQPKSNLNAYFGKGRKQANGIVRPRHWYEVELIVPKSITSQECYPKSKTDTADFDVCTDDGWRFKCKVSGDYSKNFRSAHDLSILGKWIKGKLERSGALQVGEPVTKKTLEIYGNDLLTLTQTKEKGIWLLDFKRYG